MGVLNKLLDEINLVTTSKRPPFPDVSPILMLCDIKNRSGLSAISLGSSVIARLPEIGISNGLNPDGSENLINKFVMLFAEELIKEIKTNGISLNVVEPGALSIAGMGSSAAGPVTFNGTNTTPTNVRGSLF